MKIISPEWKIVFFSLFISITALITACATSETATSIPHAPEPQTEAPYVDPCLDKRIMIEGDIEIQGLLNAMEAYKPPINLGAFFRAKRILLDVIEEYRPALGICYAANEYNHRLDAVLKRMEELTSRAIRQWMTYMEKEQEKRKAELSHEHTAR
jgi:hypothetical protein